MSRVNERREGRISLYDYIGYDDHAMPMFDTILEDGTMPAQNEEMIGTEIPLWYHDVNYGDKQRGIFTVVRWDTESPNRIILINTDLDIILVSGEDKVIDDGTGQADEIGQAVNNAYIHKYPIQDESLIGKECWIEYPKGTYKNRGVVVRADVDSDHPEYVIAEQVNEDSEVRYITAEEARIVFQYPDLTTLTRKDVNLKSMEVTTDEDDSYDTE